jgi:hypothetical protein
MKITVKERAETISMPESAVARDWTDFCFRSSALKNTFKKETRFHCGCEALFGKKDFDTESDEEKQSEHLDVPLFCSLAESGNNNVKYEYGRVVLKSRRYQQNIATGINLVKMAAESSHSLGQVLDGC